jgi:hypothetical protein
METKTERGSYPADRQVRESKWTAVLFRQENRERYGDEWHELRVYDQEPPNPHWPEQADQVVVALLDGEDAWEGSAFQNMDAPTLRAAAKLLLEAAGKLDRKTLMGELEEWGYKVRTSGE